MHVLAPMLQLLPIGTDLFEGITAAVALATLRHMLGCLNVDKAEAYRTHDLRRGHARDLQMYGSTLKEILEAGEWRSPAFLKVSFARNEMPLYCMCALAVLGFELVGERHRARGPSWRKQR